MKIEAMPVKKIEVSKNNSKEAKLDEFSKVLSKEVSKEDEVKISKDKESLELELEDKDDKSEDHILESLVGMINLPIVETDKSEMISIPMDFDALSFEDISLSTEEALYFNQGMEAKEDIPVIVNESDVSKEILEGVMNHEEFNVIANENEVLDDFVPSSDVSDVSNKSNPIKDDRNIDISNMNISNKEFSVDDRIGLISREGFEVELDTTIKDDSKEEVTVESKEANYTENVQVKEFDKVNVSIKPEESKPVLSNDNLERVNDAIIQQIETTSKDGSSVMKVKLYPEDLGTVDVTVSMEEGKLVAKILVDNEHVKGLFAGKLSELNESLIKQNIQVEKINIDLNLNANSNPDKNQGFDLNQQGNFNHNRGSRYRNQVKVYSSKVESLVTDSSNIGSSGAISILA